MDDDGSNAGAAPLTMERVRVAAAGLTSPWTLDELSRALDEPSSMVRGYVERMLEGGSIEEVGPDPSRDDDRASRMYSAHATALGDD